MIDDDDKNMKQQQQQTKNGKSPHTHQNYDSDSCNALCITFTHFTKCGSAVVWLFERILIHAY